MPDRPVIDLVAIRDRHPQHFARFDRQRLLAILTGIAAFALLLFGMAQLGFFGGTLLSGSLRLLEIAGLMLPPDPGSWAHARIFGMALLEAPCWTRALPSCLSGIRTLSLRECSATLLKALFQWPVSRGMSRTAGVRTPCATWTRGMACE